MVETYIDPKGYRRFCDSNKSVHRWVAYKYIYKVNKYKLRFSNYQVHHIDGDKLNNNSDNLILLTNSQHNKIF